MFYMIYTYEIYLGDKDVIEVNPCAIQLFHRICIQYCLLMYHDTFKLYNYILKLHTEYNICSAWFLDIRMSFQRGRLY